jgi:hypothetical protein
MKIMKGGIGLISMAVACLILLAQAGHAQMIDGRNAPRNAAPLAYGTSGEPWSPRPGQQVRYKYQYYPDSQVYYEPSREVFFYRYQGEWLKSPTLPRALRDRLGDFIIVEMYATDPTVFHADVVRKYGDEEDEARYPAAQPMDETPEPTSAPATAERPQAAPSPRPEFKYRYHYYPAEQVYYDPSRELYFYFENRWTKAASLPRHIEEHLGDYVFVEMPTDAPYELHSLVRKATREPAAQTAAEKPSGPPPWKPRGVEPVYRYEYYPDGFVFYDLDRKIYFYQPQDEWVESPDLPKYLSQNIGLPVTLEMNTPRPYLYQREVAERYPHPGMGVNFSRPIYRVWKETVIKE